MVRSLTTCIAAALALGLTVSLAQAKSAPHRHHYAAVRPGDIVVHARRSFLDPGPPAWSEVGTGNRYVSDTSPSSFLDFGGPFTSNPGAFALLPSRFNPPGEPVALFGF